MPRNDPFVAFAVSFPSPIHPAFRQKGDPALRWSVVLVYLRRPWLTDRMSCHEMPCRMVFGSSFGSSRFSSYLRARFYGSARLSAACRKIDEKSSSGICRTKNTKNMYRSKAHNLALVSRRCASRISMTVHVHWFSGFI